MTSALTTPDTGAIITATIKVDLTHTYQGDLRVAVTHAGQTVVLHDRAGGSADNIQRSFDVPGFAGVSSAGEWTLKVQDLAAQDVGTLNTWSVDLTWR